MRNDWRRTAAGLLALPLVGCAVPHTVHVSPRLAARSSPITRIGVVPAYYAVSGPVMMGEVQQAEKEGKPKSQRDPTVLMALRVVEVTKAVATELTTLGFETQTLRGDGVQQANRDYFGTGRADMMHRNPAAPAVVQPTIAFASEAGVDALVLTRMWAGLLEVILVDGKTGEILWLDSAFDRAPFEVRARIALRSLPARPVAAPTSSPL